MTTWHGWSTNDSRDALHVGPVPWRKSIALYTIHGGSMMVLAYFRREADALDAMDMIDALTGAK